MRRKIFESLLVWKLFKDLPCSAVLTLASRTMPPRSFIAMDDYTSPKEMAEHLLKLENDKWVLCSLTVSLSISSCSCFSTLFLLETVYKDLFLRKLYEEYFAWRKGGWTAAPWNAPGYRNGFCRLCERLWEENQETKVVSWWLSTSTVIRLYLQLSDRSFRSMMCGRGLIRSRSVKTTTLWRNGWRRSGPSHMRQPYK